MYNCDVGCSVKMHGSKKTYDGKIAGLYDLEETLGRGHFAVVKLARHVFTGEKVAVKVIDKTKLDEVSRSHLFQEMNTPFSLVLKMTGCAIDVEEVQEKAHNLQLGARVSVRCMKLVQHPNVIRLYEVIDTQTKLYLILELGDGGDLYDYIMKHEAGLGEDMAKEYFRQIVRAISYCHQLHVVHRDLKPENVVFFERLGVVKLTDFGFSNKFCPGQKLDTSCGSLAYSAPEILLGDSYDAPAVDVWSLGVILYMLVAGQAPFQEANDSETLTMIMDCKYTIPTHVSDACKRLIAKMLVREPEFRATLEDIASDPWLGGPPQVEYLPLVSRHQVTEEDHNIIINKMVNGSIATKEEVLEALDRNEYNHITATYFLLAERKLRTYRQEQAQNNSKRIQSVSGVPPGKNSLGKAHSADSTPLDALPSLRYTLNVPRTPGETTQGKVRKCSIVQEEEDEEEICSVVGSGQELTPPHASLNRRGSRSEGKLSAIVQERIAEEGRKEKNESPSTSPHPSNVGRLPAKDDANWPSKRTSPTSIHSGISAPYIPSSITRRPFISKTTIVQTASLDTTRVRMDGNVALNNENASGDSTLKTVNAERTRECKTSITTSIKPATGSNVVNSSQGNIPVVAASTVNSSDIAEKSLKDSATITIPIVTVQNGTSGAPKFKTMPSPTRTSTPALSSTFEGIPELSVASGEILTNRKGIPTINYEQRRSKFHKARTASCSSSDASDDDSESRKKRAHKISIEKNRRDSHDDSRDSQDRGGNGGAGGNPASGLGNNGDGMHNQEQTNRSSGNESSAGGNQSTGSSNQRQCCNGENFRRSRRRMVETRLRESQSLNRIMEVQESEVNSSLSMMDVFRERFKNNEASPQKSLECGSNVYESASAEKSRAGRSLGARFLQTWSNTISSTKFSVQKRKFVGDVRGSRPGEMRISEQLPKNYSDEKENKALIEKNGKKMKVLGRYFQVSKKLCIPIPSLSSKGRLYKARSCGSISKDRIALAVTSGTSTLKPDMNGLIRRKHGTQERLYHGGQKSPVNLIMNHNIECTYAVNGISKKSPNRSWRNKQQSAQESEELSVDGKLEPVPKGNVSKNMSKRTSAGPYTCPNVGVCQMHMRDAAKCHVS
ncbi:hypothetical protein RUM44_003125 [Polyplax serrata]|uniref:Protein kinase domain-containing protein n=1 Tax=Polyplax serrata TaxID=468196 RepID=A0ABR1AXM0_POLSC